jgi:hypothetical protein
MGPNCDSTFLDFQVRYPHTIFFLPIFYTGVTILKRRFRTRNEMKMNQYLITLQSVSLDLLIDNNAEFHF